MKYFFTCCSLFVIFSLYAQQYHLDKIKIPVSSHFRGLSVVDDQVAWIAGTGGQVGRSVDGGHTWTFTTVPGFSDPKADFRTLYAFDAKRAVIGNAGSPAQLLLTTDGGTTWTNVYTNTHPNAFFDGIDFWNSKEGIVYGDPIDGKMLLLRTTDGGSSWQGIDSAPVLAKGEASFAASDTGIHCLQQGNVIIATGGVVSRLWSSEDKGQHWKSIAVPMLQGGTMTGVFSFTQNEHTLHIVGGEYAKEEAATVHHYFSTDNGKTWLKASPAVGGFRECIEPISNKVLIALGPTGADISSDNGRTWSPLSAEKDLHTVRKARTGSLVIAAGGNGAVFLVLK